MNFSLWVSGNDSIQPRIYVNGLTTSVDAWIERLPDGNGWVPRVKSLDSAGRKPYDELRQTTPLQAAMTVDRDKELRSQIVDALARRIGLQDAQDIYKLTFDDIVMRGHITPLKDDQLWRTKRPGRQHALPTQTKKKGKGLQRC